MPELDEPARRVYRRHRTYALCDAVASGVLANAPVVALKEFGAQDRDLALPLFVSSIGMLVAPWLAERMAGRRKSSFVAAPMVAYGACACALAAVRSPLAFMALLGLCNLFEVLCRPALTVLIRESYPVEQRGAAVGEIRRWCAAVFLVTSLGTAALLDAYTGDRRAVVVVLAGVTGLTCFAGAGAMLGVGGATAGPPAGGWLASAVGAARIVYADGRFRRYLTGCFLFGFCGLLYVSFVPAFFSKRLGFGYVEIVLLVHVIPSVAAVAVTGALGRWFDRTNPLVGWCAVRLGWGIDPLVLVAAPFAATVWGPAGFLVCVAARVCRGAVMGGSWVLWWQIGVNYFAPPGADTGRYQALLTGLNGVMRMAASAVGALVLTAFGPIEVMLVGGAGVLVSALHAWAQARADARLTGFRTFAEAERATGAPEPVLPLARAGEPRH